MRHVHVIAGTALLVLLPLGSLAFRSNAFAWTMYSSSGEHRIDIRVKDENGAWHSVAPTGLADVAAPSASDTLIGADHFRRGPSMAVVRSHLDALARLACRARHGSEAQATLHERRDASAVERITTSHVVCH